MAELLNTSLSDGIAKDMQVTEVVSDATVSRKDTRPIGAQLSTSSTRLNSQALMLP
jgi:major membrane immunogen (membrane-anchored lipoprotein)